MKAQKLWTKINHSGSLVTARESQQSGTEIESRGTTDRHFQRLWSMGTIQTSNFSRHSLVYKCPLIQVEEALSLLTNCQFPHVLQPNNWLNNIKMTPVMGSTRISSVYTWLVCPKSWICIQVNAVPPQHRSRWVTRSCKPHCEPEVACSLALCLENSQLFQEFCFVDPNRTLIFLQDIDIETRTPKPDRIRDTIQNCFFW